MGFANLNVWISDRDPCRISMSDWVVSVTNCDGRPVEWCEPGPAGTELKHGSPFPAPCGHVDIRLPPGCYIVFAGGKMVFGSFKWFFFTDSCIVTVGCDDSACVHLFLRTDRHHLHWAVNGAARLAEEQTISREEADRLREAVNAVLDHLPKTSFDLEEERQSEQWSRMQEPTT